ncbi:MAG: bis(5'-nucleosyl)-tetraphosphatase (symmetrical) YqeK [Vulcanimicrobiaceae bacterium]
MRYEWAALARALRAEVGRAERYAHCLRVARCAEGLARTHGADPLRARVAGLLHDLARNRTPAELLAFCAEHGLAIEPFERRFPIVLHAKVGAELARTQLGIDDPHILEAIRCHTLGAPAMGTVAALVFVADAIEPGRRYPERAALARLALENLAAATLAVLHSTIGYLHERGLAAAPQTLAAVDALAVKEASS